MANISNTITLKDGMSPVLSSVINSVKMTVTAMRDLDRTSERKTTAKAFNAALASINDAEIALKKFNAENNKIEPKKTQNVAAYFGKISGVIAAAAAALYSFNRGLSAFNKLNEEYYNRDFAATRLANQLKLTSKNRISGENLQGDLTRLSDKSSQQTIVGDVEYQAGASQLASYQLTGDSIKKLMPSVRDLAAGIYGTNINMDNLISTAQLFGKAMAGEASTLQRYGIILNDAQRNLLTFGTEQQKVAVLSDVISRAYGGLATALAQTPQGLSIKVKNELGNIYADVGQMTTQILAETFSGAEKYLPELRSTLTDVVIILRPFMASLSKVWIPTIAAIIKGLVSTTKLITFSILAVPNHLVKIWTYFKYIGLTAIDAIRSAFVGLIKIVVNGFIDRLNGVLNIYNALTHKNLAIPKLDSEFEKFNSRGIERTSNLEKSLAEQKKAYQQLADDFLSPQKALSGASVVWAGFTKNSKINVGTVDEIKKGTVKIEAQDIENLKHIAEREFMLRLNNIAPAVNVGTMSVRETVDVAKVMQAIENKVSDLTQTTLTGGEL